MIYLPICHIFNLDGDGINLIRFLVADVLTIDGVVSKQQKQLN